MLLFGLKDIDSPKFIRVDSIEEIKTTTSKDILLLNGLKKPYKLAKYAQKNSLSFAVEVNSIKEALIASTLGASFSLANKTLAKTLQKIADNYLWDMKILAIISSEDEIEEIGLLEIDGAVLRA